LPACTTVSAEEREALLGKPVDCAVAEQDIADLQAAMPSRRERAGSVVRTVTPVGAVASVATGSYRDRAAVLTGRTENELNALGSKRSSKPVASTAQTTRTPEAMS
jgi:hypothetical protein